MMIDHVARICADCGREFHVLQTDSWKTVCRHCYKGEMDARVMVRKLQADITQLHRQLSTIRLTGPSNFDARRWRQLLQLVHPDKHQGSIASTEATKWLNSIRDQVDH